MHVALVHNHVGGRADGGGGVRQMIELALGLQRLGHRVTVVAHDHEPAAPAREGALALDIRAVREGPFQVPPSRAAWFERQWIGMGRVAALIPRDADVVNAHEWPAVHAALRAQRRSGAPVVWSRNDETIFEKALMPELAIDARRGASARTLGLATGLPDRVAARRASCVVVLDERNAALVRRAFGVEPAVVRSGPAERFFAVPDRASARRRVGVEDEQFLALAVGILLPHRRFEDLIDAVGLVGSERLRVQIVGSDHRDADYGRRLLRRASGLGLDDVVALRRDGVSESELLDLHAAADIFVSTDRRQAYGLATLEALAAGTPAIVSSGAGVLDVLRGRAGVTVVPPGAPEQLAAALRHQMDAPAEDLANTRAWLRSNLTNDHYAAHMAAIFDAAIGSVSRSSSWRDRLRRHASPQARRRP